MITPNSLPPLTVGLDITSLLYQRGVSRYTANLAHALAQQPGLTLKLYGAAGRQKGWLEHQARQVLHDSKSGRHQVKISHLPTSLHTKLWQWLPINSVRKALGPLDVFHSWDWIQPPDRDLPLVSTIHDLAILKYPDTAHPDVLKHHQDSWKILKERRAHIVAVSAATKNDVCTLLDFPADRVHVVYEALPRETTRVSESLTEEITDKLKIKLRLNKPYILFVGTREPRKNLARLLQAWQPLAKEVDLLIAGAAGWDASDELGRTLTHQPRFLGQVSDRELAVLYNEAELLAYPSLDEGFGLPILEAFYYGTPVLTSNRSALKEVAGNAAVLIDPESVESITAGLQELLQESDQEQAVRLKKMILRLHLFSWSATAKATLAVYHQAHQDFI